MKELELLKFIKNRWIDVTCNGKYIVATGNSKVECMNAKTNEIVNAKSGNNSYVVYDVSPEDKTFISIQAEQKVIVRSLPELKKCAFLNTGEDSFIFDAFYISENSICLCGNLCNNRDIYSVEEWDFKTNQRKTIEEYSKKDYHIGKVKYIDGVYYVFGTTLRQIKGEYTEINSDNCKSIFFSNKYAGTLLGEMDFYNNRILLERIAPENRCLGFFDLESKHFVEIIPTETIDQMCWFDKNTIFYEEITGNSKFYNIETGEETVYKQIKSVENMKMDRNGEFFIINTIFGAYIFSHEDGRNTENKLFLTEPNDEDALMRVFDYIIDKIDGNLEQRFDELNEYQKAFVTMWLFQMELPEGGLCQYLINSDDSVIMFTCKALTLIGCEKSAGVLDRFFDKYNIFSNLSEIRDLANIDYKNILKKYSFDDVEDKFFNDESLNDLLACFAKENHKLLFEGQ